MTYAQKLRAALHDQLGKDWLVFMPRWDVQRRCAWQGKGGVPAALMLHHTAAAATDSVNPRAAGNQKGANRNVITYIQTHYEVPAASFTLDRDGTVYVHSALPVWHAGLGTFQGKPPWNQLGIRADTANDHLLGVEIMSKGLKKDFTVAQQDSLVFLLRACRDASGWDNVGLLRRPQHKSWTTRKIDTRYSDAEIGAMITKYGFTDAVPDPSRDA
jgi:hypothetical protein